MSATKVGSISGAVFGTTAEANYDVILDDVSVNNSSQESQLTDEDGDIVMAAIHGQETEVSLSFAIKGASHLGTNALVGTVISDITDSDVPSPLIVTGNSRTKSKGDWQKGTLTAKYYGDDFTTTV